MTPVRCNGLVLLAWSECATPQLTGREGPAAGLLLSVADSTGSDVQLLLSARTPVRVQRAWVTVRSAARRRNVRPLVSAFYIR